MEGVERTPDDDDGDIYGDDDVWNLKMLPDIGVLAVRHSATRILWNQSLSSFVFCDSRILMWN